MMDFLRNSPVNRCLLALLSGYFFLSSIHITPALKDIMLHGIGTNVTETMTTCILKKIFKCAGCAEEYGNDDKSENLRAKKNLSATDYHLIPSHGWDAPSAILSSAAHCKIVANHCFATLFHGEIHSPPPEV